MAEHRQHHPFQGLFDHFAEMNRMRAAVGQPAEEHSPATAWIPAADIYREGNYGPFRRTIAVPESVQREDISAVFENGLLEVTVAGASRPPADEQIEIAGPEGQR